MKDLELNCEYVPEDTLTVSNYDNFATKSSIYLAQVTENGKENSEIKLSRYQVEELRKWLLKWLLETA